MKNTADIFNILYYSRYFLDTAEDARPSRFQQLTEIHGLLKPLVHIDLTPEVNLSFYL